MVTDVLVKTQLSNAMAEDFARDLRQDGILEEKIQVQVQRSKDRINSAPVVVLLCLDMSEMDSYPDARRQQAEWTMAMQSVAAAGLQLLLGAHAEGLAGVWVCSPLFTQEIIQKTLRLPEAWEPQGMFFLGYADGLPKHKEMKPLQGVLKWV